MKTKVVILNAPSKSGKDAVAEHMCGNGLPYARREFKDKLYDLVMCIYGVNEGDFFRIYSSDKELPLECFGGLSVRQAMIKVSEEVIKPNFGKDYFGKQLAGSLVGGMVNVVSDGGFIEELVPVIEAVGEENILIIRIAREGYTFKGDSRAYLPLGTVPNEVWIDNDSSLDVFFTRVEKAIEEFIGDEDV